MTLKKQGITLLELLIAIGLLSVIVLGVSSISIFSRHHAINSTVRSQLQAEIFLVIEHMNKRISRAIGNEFIDGDDMVVSLSEDASWKTIRVYIDTNDNGIRDDGANAWVCYRFDKTNFEMLFGEGCDTSCVCTGGTQVFTRGLIDDFTATKPNDPGQLDHNNVTVAVTACRDPAIAVSVDNPCESMESRIVMPSVSTN
ncbi:MAG: prepilin-type N-terminal cleavage/methylation domain-containing protein [Candidatus Omnitrophota bacterium]